MKVIGISYRYICTRKQFGTKHQESTLISYPLVQSKVFRHLSKTLVLKYFTDHLLQNLKKLESANLESVEMKELHALNSYIKCQNSYHSMEAMLDMRELCGGHGYSSYSGFNVITDQNVQITWEGTNDVLIQQTAKFLVSVLMKYVQKGKVIIPSFYFLEQLDKEDLMVREVKHISKYFESLDVKSFDFQMLLLCLQRMQEMKIKKMVNIIVQEVTKLASEIQDEFQFFNLLYSKELRKLCFMYGDYVASVSFLEFLKKIENPSLQHEQKYLITMLTLHMIRLVEDDFDYFESSFSLDLKQKLKALSYELYPSVINDSLILIDSQLPPDELLNSTIGKSNGDVYRNIMNKVLSVRDNVGKFDNWKELNKLRGREINQK